MLLTIGLQAGPGAKAQLLEFIQPTNGAVFSTGHEIPIVLRASVPDDVVLSADVFANFFQKIGTALYCCPVCDCAPPNPGQEIILKVFVSANGRPVSGWTNISARNYQLTAKGVSEKGTPVEAKPVDITVLDLTLHIGRDRDGTIVLRIAEGAMVEGRYDLEASEDLQSWVHLGPFSPGNVAAFYWDKPPDNARTRFYRSVFVPPRLP